MKCKSGVEFENSETNLIQSFKKYKLDIPNETGLSTESRPPTNETRSPGDGFIDRKRLSQTGLNHYISIGTVFNPLNRCILWGKKQINVVLDTFYGANECGSICKAFYWSWNRQGSDNGKPVQHRQRVTQGQAWVFDRQTESRGLIRKQTIVQTGVNRVQTARR